ncbi:MAG: hypothetical protein A2527_09780 [Candidatus Lambdaproteobacteria bacterium RIFOXYD2_FULL_50_16]|uniref:Excalibur calcium-binding domain-containing protein n=1 Tax=Candidatus Lambdaproteobacteria bacterium RIFOXYD2_FULL_50_16 TaxID=1817772 RepID=A0A1F6G7Q8_9PROT|nr:MAG: hypothetical protein A2527_09780 [Candidatus Lambdaproteobacteria bacterium RIFOXYD2_FULL_50_16]
MRVSVILLAALCLTCLPLWAQQTAPQAQTTTPAQAPSGQPQQTSQGAPGAAPQGQAGPTPEGNGPPARQSNYEYTTQISKAQQAQGWAKVYFESFKRSREYRYLQLASQQTLLSVQILYNTQEALPKTNRFYYKTRKKRMHACDYYQVLKEASYSFDSSRYLRDPPGGLCQF